MTMDILVSEDFERALGFLSPSMREIVSRKVRLLVEDPSYPSLQTHRLNQVKSKDIWDCYISDSMRLLYEIKEGCLYLWNLGAHGIVDKVHLREFASHRPFHHMSGLTLENSVAEAVDSPKSASELTHVIYPLLQTTEVREQGSSNRFTFFQNAHLRILGVPSNLVHSIKSASSIEEALALPGLPERTRLWLEEISTSVELEPVMFDSSRLLFRTTLDKLEGYCAGKIKRLMLNLQRPEQQKYVDLEGEPLILLKGAAGSGKTTLGIYRAIRLASQGRRVLVLAFNHTLSSATKSLIEELIGPLPQNLEVMTLHSLMMSVLYNHSIKLNLPKQEKVDEPRKCLHEALNVVRKRNNATVLQRDEKFFEEEIKRVIKGLGLKNVGEYKNVKRYGRKTALKPLQREAVWNVYEAYEQQLSRARLNDWADVAIRTLQTLQKWPFYDFYDDIIVDEAQDLTPVDLRVIRLLIAPATLSTSKSNSIMILGDVAQTLYSRVFSWGQIGMQTRVRTATLRKNYRNTRQIAEAAAQLLKQNTLMRSLNQYVDPEWTQRQGSYPIVMKAASNYNQIELVRNRILDLVSDQTFRLSDFAVLCRTNATCERCKQDFERAGLRTVHHRDSDFDLLEERVKILTIHSSKGLEFPVVFLLGLTEDELPWMHDLKYIDEDAEEEQLYIEQERTLCYVGMTRAAEALYLLTVKGIESRFLNEIAGKVVQS